MVTLIEVLNHNKYLILEVKYEIVVTLNGVEVTYLTLTPFYITDLLLLYMLKIID